ncbi:MAG: aldehyde dehydrogenase [Balneolaceae bacterium]|jgi:aldehyde dehydrogenase (NAD+)
MEQVVRRQHQFFEQGKSRSVTFRKKQLKKLKGILLESEEAFYEALRADFKKPPFETYATELFILYQEIEHLHGDLSAWAAPQKVRGSIFNFPSKNFIYPQPYGVSLVIGAWNYPLHLTLNPVLGSMAAGNCTIIKPSELASHTSSLIAEIINSNFDPGYLHVVEGGAEITQSILSEPLDYIFFTGSQRVGKIIMKAAAEQLTPVTLELGGKSPAIIDETADLSTAARRIAWGKFMNAGQTCVSPDYVYVHTSRRDEFFELLQKNITGFYGEDPSQSPDFAHIINRNHFERLENMIDPQKVLIGGKTKPEERYIEPTVMTNINWDDKVMQNEIFGPILPVLSFQDMDGVIASIKVRSKPLALYLFSKNKTTQERVINGIPFGGGCINDTVAHLANPELDFGGVGHSGIGSYHGKKSFDLFSHQKSIMKKGTWLDIPLRYPPYRNNLKWLKKLTKII